MKLTASKSNNPNRWPQVARAWTAGCIAAGSILLAFTGMAQAQEQAADSRIEALGEAYNLQNKVVPASQSRIIFYSPATTKLPGAATVYVNGRYCWFISKSEPFPPSFTTKFEPRSTYPAIFLGRVCRSDQRGNT